MRKWFVHGFVGFVLGMEAGADEVTKVEEFEKVVQPFLVEHCTGCHGEKKQKADFALHDIDGVISNGKETVRWEKILEMVSLGDMPPEDEPQPSKVERSRIEGWIAAELAKIGRGHDPAKLALPNQANRVSHEDLFSGDHKGPASSPSRLWRKSPEIYARFSKEVGLKLSQPLLGMGGKGIQDYASLFADEATINTMMRNSNLIAEHMVSPKRSHMNRHLNALFKDGVKPKEEQVERAMVELFKLIFQRKPTAEDRERYVAVLFEKGRELGGLSLGFKSLIKGMLMSQEFVFRVEVGMGEALPDGRRKLNSIETAYALSFAFFDQPNADLLKAAGEGNLDAPDGVAEEVRKILEKKDAQKRYWSYPMYHRWGDDYYHVAPRVLRFFQEFFGYMAVGDVFKDKERSHEHHANRLRKDADMFVLHALEKDRDVLTTLLTSNHYPMDYLREDRMKGLLGGNNRYRGIKEQYGEEFEAIAKSGKWPGIGSNHVRAYNLNEERAKSVRRDPGDLVEFPKEERAGMLTHPAWLVAHSGNFDNDPIRRGKWIRERLLADLVPEVPIGVDAKVPEDPHRTLRERLDLVRAEECWRCHKKMNPLGEAFEAYDDFGKYRKLIVLGDADAYFKAKRKYDGQRKNWEKELKEWKSYDAKGRAAKVAHAKKILADLKKPEAEVKSYKAALRGYENNVKRWTKERDHWLKVDDAEQARRIEGLEKRLAEMKPPVAETKPVDASGVLSGTGDPKLDGEFENAIELANRLAKSERVRQSFVRHAFRYWMGRNETLSDSPTLIEADRVYLESGGSFKAMLTSLLSSDSFLYRKDPAPNKP
ncbi:MAG: DUF1588 domain-containing protein [Akkermansiaceae bacterium]|nr:DUF1588 domain-containing protein [Akkermansiaceae bacterium]